MKKTNLTQAIDHVVALRMKAVDKYFDEVIEPLTEVGNPEKLIGKPYESWTLEDMQRLVQIYGEKEPNLLSNLIFRKEYERVKQLEAEESA